MNIRTVDVILPASESTLPGDFTVYRALPRRELRRVGGFVFLDHFDRENITPELFDVPPHPHVGLQTVTYLYSGEILHTDSLDYEQMISPGDVNWMTAGRGITHAEQVAEPQPRLHGLQSWVGLPHADRSAEPAFEHFPQSGLPLIEDGGVSVRVIAGRFGDQSSPIPTFQELVYLDISAATGASYEIAVDPRHELALYVAEGSIEAGGRRLDLHDLGKLGPGSNVAFTALENSKFVLIGGEPLPEPTTIYWNFITDSVGEAKQRMIDWEDGKFPPVRKYRKLYDHGPLDDLDVTTLM